MTTVNLGKIQPKYRGVYSSGTAYTALDYITYGGSTYWCIAACTGIAPGNESYWMLIGAGILNLVEDSTPQLGGDLDLNGFKILSAYGVSWDELADTYVRTGGLVGQPVSQTLNNAMLPIHASMRRCILNDAGEVQYYLGATDSTKREDGVIASDLTGGDGQVMVQFAKFFYRYSYTGTTHTWEVSLTPAAGFSVHPAFIKNGEVVDYRYMGAYEGIGWDASVAAYIDSTNVADTGWSDTVIDLAVDILSSVSGKCPVTDETRAEFRAIAANRGTGWRQVDFDLASAAILMYITEYADWNSQAMIGAGRTTLSGGSSVKDSYIGTTGLSNSDGNGTNSVSNGTTAGFLTDYMTYRGIENLFGNSWTWVDGINLNKVSNVYVCNTDTDFADGTATGYTDLGITIAPVGGWQKYMTQQPRGFLSSSAGGSSTTYITDYYSRPAGWCVMALGGHSIDGAYAGIADCNMIQTSSYASASFGSRLAY